ncbi:MAG TPA: ABC transporter permease [Lentimicrobium sp.]|nr:ABC transporter permease [Lentimicrobium sp.]
MNKLKSFQLIFTFLGGIVLLLIIAPLAGMFLETSTASIFETAREKEVTGSIWLTIWTSLLGTLMFAIAAIPLSYILARKSFFMKRLVTGIIDLPVVIPHSAAGIAILGFLSRDSFVGKAGSAIGLDFVGNPAGIIVAMAFVSIPYLINSARDGFAAVPLRLEKAALTLGASQSRVFFTISLPLAWRNILSGLILMFARGMSEFGAVIVVAYHPMITPVLIYERFGAFGLKYARPVSVIFILISLSVFIVLRLLSKETNSNKDKKEIINYKAR